MAERRSYHERIAQLDPAKLVSIDGAGITTRMTRSHARAPRGQRARGTTAPYGHWHRVTLLGALGCDGLVAVMGVEAATSTPVFLACVEQVLTPELRRTKPGAVVVMDNLRPHKAAAVRRTLAAAGWA